MMFSMILEALEKRAMMSATTAVAPQTEVAPDTTSTAPATVAAPGGLSVFAWGNTRDPSSIHGLYWASLDQDPIAEAKRLAPQLIQAKAGTRAVFLFDSMGAAFKSLNAATAPAFVANGPDISHDLLWSQRFFAELKTLGAPVDRVVTDNENSFNTWVVLGQVSTPAQQVALMQSIYNNPAAYAKLPVSVRAFTPSDFGNLFSARGHAAFNAWNDWAQSVTAQAYKTAVVAPAQQFFGTGVKVSNYGDIASKVQLTDSLGWTIAEPNSTIPGNVSSPVTYITNGSKYSSYKKDWRWNRLIDVLNEVRAAQNVPNTTVTPWVGPPKYLGATAPAKSNWLWEQLIRQMSANGISSFYYWNPHENTSPSDDQFAASLFNSLTPGTAQSLPQISFDADQIVTGNVVTTYAEFLKFVDMPGATDMNPTVPAAPPPITPAAAPATTGQSQLDSSTDSSQLAAVAQPTPVVPTVTPPKPNPPMHLPTITRVNPLHQQPMASYLRGTLGSTQTATVDKSMTFSLNSNQNVDDLLDGLAKK
jgi:hypothetical protein